MFNGRNSKESFQYSMEYYALKEDIREVLPFREYCTLEIHKIFRDPYYGTNKKRIAHMVDEVCKEVETRRLPPGAKRGGKKEDSSKPYACPSSKPYACPKEEEVKTKLPVTILMKKPQVP